MHGSDLMQTLKAIKYLLQIPNSIVLAQKLLAMDILFHIKSTAILHDEKNTGRRLKNIITLDDIIIVTVFEYINLSFNQFI